MVKQFPRLCDYANAWPVDDALRLRLKYTSQQKRAEARVAAAIASAAVVLKEKPLERGKGNRSVARNGRKSHADQ